MTSLPRPMRKQIRIAPSTWRLAGAAAKLQGKTLSLFVAEAIVTKVMTDCPQVLQIAPKKEASK